MDLVCTKGKKEENKTVPVPALWRAHLLPLAKTDFLLLC
jgi:hypothetical protein